MRPVGGHIDDHDHEFDEARWVPIDEALPLMTHETERAVVQAATELLAHDAASATLRSSGGAP